MNAGRERKKKPQCSFHDTWASEPRLNASHIVQIKAEKKSRRRDGATQPQQQSCPSVLFVHLVQQQLDHSGFSCARVPLVHLVSLRWKTLRFCWQVLQPITFLPGDQTAAKGMKEARGGGAVVTLVQ